MEVDKETEGTQKVEPKMRMEKPKNMISYEELKNVCMQQQQQLNKAFQEIHMLRNQSEMARLSFLFKVVELNDKGFSADFVTNCIEQIEETMTPINLPDYDENMIPEGTYDTSEKQGKPSESAD